MKKYFLIILLGGFSGLIHLHAQNKVVNVGTELKKMGNIAELPRYIDDTKLLQVSSHDTTGGNDDGFSGAYSFIRKNPDSSLVIFEEKGNGVINRIWTPTPTSDTLDFYFGGSEEPSFSVKFIDLFSGAQYPFVAPLSGNEIGGYYNYFPIPFENGLKIVFRGKKLEFYQIQHRSYPDNYKIQDFSLNLSDVEKDAFEKMKEGWEEIGNLDAEIRKEDAILRPGQTLTLAEFNEGGRILGFTMDNAEIFQGLNRQIDLKVTWDDEKSPAIYMPVADFFGYAFGQISMQSLLIGTKNNINYSYFPMPFDKKAKIELIYRSSGSVEENRPLEIKSKFFVSREKRNTREEGKFYAFWNKDKNTSPGEAHLLLTGKGKGHYVGTILQTQGLIPGMTLFFEGDDVTTIDGEMRVHGTGSEDYFNGGWYALMDRWDRKVSLPLHGSLDYTLPYSRTGGYRFFILDKMPFERDIHHTIEHGPEENNMPGDYTSAAFYYAEAVVHKNQLGPSNELTGTYIPDTFVLYPQLMKYTFAGKVTVDGEVLSSTTGGSVRIDLSEIPEGRYKLYAEIGKSPEGAEISIWQRQKEIAESVSFYSETAEIEDKKYLSDIVIDDFRETISLRFKNNPDRSKIRIKRLFLEREKL